MYQTHHTSQVHNTKALDETAIRVDIPCHWFGNMCRRGSLRHSANMMACSRSFIHCSQDCDRTKTRATLTTNYDFRKHSYNPKKNGISFLHRSQVSTTSPEFVPVLAPRTLSIALFVRPNQKVYKNLPWRKEGYLHDTLLCLLPINLFRRSLRLQHCQLPPRLNPRSIHLAIASSLLVSYTVNDRLVFLKE